MNDDFNAAAIESADEQLHDDTLSANLDGAVDVSGIIDGPEQDQDIEDNSSANDAVSLDAREGGADGQNSDSRIDRVVPVPIPNEGPRPHGDQTGRQLSLVGTAAGSQATGDARVDSAVARLSELADLPVAEHVAVFEDIHRRLQEALVTIDDDTSSP